MNNKAPMKLNDGTLKRIPPFLCGRLCGTLLMSLTALLFTGLPTNAATRTWDGNGSATATGLGTANNWSNDTLPTTSDEVLFSSLTPTVTLQSTANTATYGNFIWNVSTGSSGTVTVQSGASVDKNLQLSGGGGSTAAIANGGATGDLFLLGNNISSGTFTVDGTANANGKVLKLTILNAGNFNIVNSGATLALGAQLFGTSTLTKTGAGALSISSNNTSTFTGSLAVSAGTLLLNGGSVAGSAVTVANDAILTGNGSVGSLTVQNGGILTPGNAGIGNLTASSVTLNPTSIANFQVNGGGAGQFDTLSASGVISLAGTLNLNFGNLLDDDVSIDLFLGAISSGTEFTSIVATGSYSGTFSPYSGSVVRLIAGAQALYFDNTTGVLAIAAVPEPNTVGLTVAGMLSLFVIFRRRRFAS